MADDVPLHTPPREHYAYILTSEVKLLGFDKSLHFPSPVGYQIGEEPVVFWDVMYIFDALKVLGDSSLTSYKLINQIKDVALGENYLGRAAIHFKGKTRGWLSWESYIMLKL